MFKVKVFNISITLNVFKDFTRQCPIYNCTFKALSDQV